MTAFDVLIGETIRRVQDEAVFCSDWGVSRVRHDTGRCADSERLRPLQVQSLPKDVDDER